MFPYTLVRLWSLLESGGDAQQIHRLQGLVTNFEGIMMKAFVPGMRAVMNIMGRSAGHSRSPIPDASPEEIVYYQKMVKDLEVEERKLSVEAIFSSA